MILCSWHLISKCFVSCFNVTFEVLYQAGMLCRGWGHCQPIWVWWPTWWKGVVIVCGSSAHCLANLSASWFSNIFECALPFLMVMLWVQAMMASMMRIMRSLSRWLYWEEGCLMWFSEKYKILRHPKMLHSACVYSLKSCHVTTKNETHTHYHTIQYHTIHVH